MIDSMAQLLPIALSQLVESLEARGFVITERVYDSQSFGNQLIELSAPDSSAATAVRLVKDRGLWEVSIQLDGGHWFGPYELKLALNDASFSTRALNHVERQNLTLEVLERIPRDRRELGVLYARLLEFRRQYTSQFFQN